MKTQKNPRLAPGAKGENDTRIQITPRPHLRQGMRRPPPDFGAVAAAALARAESLLTSWLPDGRREGAEWSAWNPTRADERRGSFRVNMATGRWADFATGDKGGDLISLFAYLHGLEQGEAARELAETLGVSPAVYRPPRRGGKGGNGKAPASPPREAPKDPWEPVAPVPDGAPEPDFTHPELGEPSKVYTYRDASGAALFRVYRWDLPSGKTIRPYSLWRNRETGGLMWRWASLPEPRPLYGLHALTQRPEAPVIVAEGERAAEAAARLFPDYVAVTSPNGAGSADKADWTPLRGRDVVLAPDNDEAGRKYAETVARILRGLGVRSLRLLPPEKLGFAMVKDGVPDARDTSKGALAQTPEGYDLADAVADGWTADLVAKAVREDHHFFEDLPEPDAEDVDPDDKPDGLAVAPPLPPFPLDVFPPAFQRAVTEIARACNNTPLETPAAALLSFTGAVIGTSYGIEEKPGHLEHPNLFMALCAPSGTGKTPAVSYLLRPVDRREAAWYRDFKTERRAHEAAMKRASRDATEPPPEPPRRRRFAVNGATAEAALKALADNGRLWWVRDELSSLFTDARKYGPNAGREQLRDLLTEAWSCRPLDVMRRDSERDFRAEVSALSIFGTTQPAVLQELFTPADAASGFLPRFIFIHAERTTPALRTRDVVSQQTHDLIDALAARFLDAPRGHDADSRVVTLTGEADAVFEAWHNDLALRAFTDPAERALESLFQKTSAHTLRFALILQVLDAVAEGTPVPLTVSGDVMRRAVRLARYALAHTVRAWAAVGAGNGGAWRTLDPIERRVAKAVVELADEGAITMGLLPTGLVTERVNAGEPEAFRLSPDKVGAVMRGLGMKGGRPDKGRRGRLVTPEILDRFRTLLKPAPAGEDTP